MTKENKKKLLSEESLRHNEYYGMQGVFDELYAQSKLLFFRLKEH